MKPLLLIPFVFFLFTNCSNKEAEITAITEKAFVIEDVEVLKKDLVLNQLEGRWYYKNVPFSGYSLLYHANDTLAEKLGYVAGKREGLAQKWSEKGVLRVESYYRHNRLNNVYKTWWDNGVLSAQSYYVNGVKQGVENEWYATGQMAKARQLVDGSENGLQKAWLPNGKLYINYEAKNGRIFGMQRANSCYKLEDEKIIRDTEI